MARVAVCFFGLVKNIDHVYASIERCILNPLKQQGYEMDFYGHTYEMSHFTNPRNHEANVPIQPKSILKRFQFKQFTIEPTTSYSHLEDDVKLCLKYGDPWPENKVISLKNHLLNLRSLYQVTQLWKGVASAYKYVIYLRPDLRFLNSLAIRNLTGMSLVVPAFHAFGGYNDRFAYGTPAAMIIYGERWSGMETYFSKHRRSIHAETFLRFHLQDHHVHVITAPIRFQRIRANNQPNPSDLRI